MRQRFSSASELARPAAPARWHRTLGGPHGTGSRSERVVLSHHAPRDALIRRLLAAADAAGVTVGLAIMAAFGSPGQAAVAWGMLTIPAWIVVFKAYGLYDRDVRRIGHETIDDLPWIFHSMLVGSLLLSLFYRSTGAVHVGFADVLLFTAVTGIATVSLRTFARRVGARILGSERVLLIGDGEQLVVVARKMRMHAEYDVEPVALLARKDDVARRAGLPLLGSLADVDLDRIIREHRIERVVIAHSAVPDGTLLDVLRRCRELAVKASVLPQLFDVIGPSVEIHDVEGVTMLGIVPPVFPRSSRLLKRSMDLAGALTLLIVTAPLIVVIAVAIRLDSVGPVFFRQQRIGRGGRTFRLVKFRTMVRNAEQQHEELRRRSGDPDWLLIEDDPRITRIGRFLRLSSLDELPQLWNVLRGEMSLVGPRPLIPSEDRLLEGWRRSRVDLTPGLTGLWQVLGRTRIPFEEMLKLDYLYVTNWSLWADVRLILRTLPAIVKRRGAN